MRLVKKGIAMRILVALVFSCLLAGCAIPPKQSLGVIHSKENYVDLSNRLNELAFKCWARDWSWFWDGVTVSSRLDFRGRVIEAKRFAIDIGVQPPFLEIIVRADRNGSSIEIMEGGELNPLSDASLETEIRYWIEGGGKCITEK